MLKALELVGFKSFADKTRFEFPSGITTIVGPNGSGKSNVVDAIKWVLGEQSVKSLRGKEMADVIFNGSGSRPPLNCAETTLTFNNADRLLPIDTPEVHVTRRVYRNGEGEYLINRQPCRLRDIRDLFSGTGVATEAYSVIEQGKVDVMLQSSPRDRRAIFEEAAGVSRFKAKKIESMRRLERVEQNLLRLADIVAEVENRLRGVRNQAVKARRYKDYNDRLQSLRTQIGLADWRRLGEELDARLSTVRTLTEEATLLDASAETLEAQSLSHDVEISAIGEAIRAAEAQLAVCRERIATSESTIDHERGRLGDLEAQAERLRRHVATMSVRAGDVENQLVDASQQFAEADAEHQAIRRRVADDERLVAQLTAQLQELRSRNEIRRGSHMDAMRSAARWTSEIKSHESQATSAQVASERLTQRQAALSTERAALSQAVDAARGQQQAASEAVHARQRELVQAQAGLAERRAKLGARIGELHQAQQRRTAAHERATLLEELELRQEGLGAGVKQVLDQVHGDAESFWKQTRGLVADRLQAGVEMAPLVDAALGAVAQYFIASNDPAWLAELANWSRQLAGPVGVLRLDDSGDRATSSDLDFTGRSGVLGRADRLVEAAPDFATLAQQLLGETWFVESLAIALELAGEAPGRNVTFVTRAGEVATTDGRLLVGRSQGGTGIISRRSELRALRQQIADAEVHIGELSIGVNLLESEVTEWEQRSTSLITAHQEALDKLSEGRVASQAAEAQLARHDEQATQLAQELADAETLLSSSTQAYERGSRELIANEQLLSELEVLIAEASREIDELDEDRLARSREATSVKVQLAKSEERLASLRVQMERYRQDQLERQRSLEENRAQLADCGARAAQAQQSILRTESHVAELYLQKERWGGEIVLLIARREQLRDERTQHTQVAQEQRAQARVVQDKLHAEDLAANELRMQRDTLASRLRDDYGIELAELQHTPSEEEQRERAQIDQEIAELRRKLQNIGSVNLEALDEVTELETRFTNLKSQYDDLASAKASLEQIIVKINADSRKLFATTLETVRGHFQVLFRKLFGGGHADIVLEQDVDILDSGVEIVARPPGKEPRSISLLSGGEKTMTCVALLLAIFRSRPSPFCVLDEVDAALDEANIERFIGVLKEFLAWTQFIIVTHSKKTMTCATTLYGVTMQETGVSKRVSVRFEDVSDNGEIRFRPRGASAEDSPPADHDETQAA
ncbi:MAG: chromosome segregation protein SMC [Pirellulales bacterium]|nr:chromosome segregation protein SMC [Pirellulales bacterium]